MMDFLHNLTKAPQCSLRAQWGRRAGKPTSTQERPCTKERKDRGTSAHHCRLGMIPCERENEKGEASSTEKRRGIQSGVTKQQGGRGSEKEKKRRN